RADGVGAVVLKPLARALADGDAIHALLRHTAVSYNGQGGASIFAPNPDSHAELIRACYRQARIDPRHVAYIEAQGMGNALADLTEWQAFNRALADLAREQGVALAPGSCRVSTLKPMLGHMESAAALGALFKVVRSLRTGVVHKVIGFEAPHPHLEADGQPCAIARETSAWPRGDAPRLAGIHAYAMGGTNAHVLVEEYRPEVHGGAKGATLVSPAASPRPQLVVLSARTDAVLRAAAGDLQAWLASTGERPLLADLAWTLQAGREEREQRAAWVVQTMDELRTALALFAQASNEPPAVPAYHGSADARAAVSGRLPDAASLTEQARHWVHGGTVAWAALHAGGAPRRVHLPAYRFELQPHWVVPAAAAARQDAPAGLAATLQQTLVGLLAEALACPVESIDPHRHLIDLGIDSVLGLRMLRTLARRHGVMAQARDLVLHGTPAALARHLAQQHEPAITTAPVPSPLVAPVATGTRHALSEGQKGLWMLQQQSPRMCAYNI
ncbi:MAG TPA: phosphopantetheine-binding protein, partial [Ramlibacter sp.]